MSMTFVSASPPCRLFVRPLPIWLAIWQNRPLIAVLWASSSPVVSWAPSRESHPSRVPSRDPCPCRAPLDETPRSAAPLDYAPFGSVAAARDERLKMGPTFASGLPNALASYISLTFSLTMHHASVTAMSAWSATIATASASWEPPMKNSADHMVAEHTPSP